MIARREKIGGWVKREMGIVNNIMTSCTVTNDYQNQGGDHIVKSKNVESLFFMLEVNVTNI